jgi:hypothetical protein
MKGGTKPQPGARRPENFKMAQKNLEGFIQSRTQDQGGSAKTRPVGTKGRQLESRRRP